MKRKLTAGQTSVSLPIFVQDTSSTTGGGLSGLTSATSGLVAEYRRRGDSAWTAITLVAKTLGTFTSGGIVADGALGGAYELDVPNAACAAGVRWVVIRLRGATNMLPCLIEMELDAVDYQNATTFGLTNLDAAISSRMATFTQPTGFLAATFPTGTIANTTNLTAGTIATVTNLTNAPTAGDLTAAMKASVNAEVLDVLSVDTFAELAAVPAATSSLKDKITWLFMWARNRATQTASQRRLFADDATTVVSTEAVSDNGTTYDKGEAS